MVDTQIQKIVPIVQPQAIKDNTEFVGSKGSTPVTISTIGFDQCDIYVLVGATDIKMATMKLYEADATTYAAVTGGDFGSPDILPIDTDDNKVFGWHISLLGRKKNLQIELIPGDGATGTYAAAFAILSRAGQAPSTAAGRGLAAELFV